MNKLLWCGAVTGAIVAVGVHVIRPVRQSLNDSPACCVMVPHCDDAEMTDPYPDNAPHADAIPGAIALASSTNGVGSIIIAEGEDENRAEPMPVAEEEESESVVPIHAVMPYAIDDETAPRWMPYAEADGWIRSSDAPSQISEVIETIKSWLMPECREDANLFQQYPGCPFIGAEKSSTKPAPAVESWTKQKQPILPVGPQELP